MLAVTLIKYSRMVGWPGFTELEWIWDENVMGPMSVTMPSTVWSK